MVKDAIMPKGMKKKICSNAEKCLSAVCAARIPHWCNIEKPYACGEEIFVKCVPVKKGKKA